MGKSKGVKPRSNFASNIKWNQLLFSLKSSENRRGFYRDKVYVKILILCNVYMG